MKFFPNFFLFLRPNIIYDFFRISSSFRLITIKDLISNKNKTKKEQSNLEKGAWRVKKLYLSKRLAQKGFFLLLKKRALMTFSLSYSFLYELFGKSWDLSKKCLRKKMRVKNSKSWLKWCFWAWWFLIDWHGTVFLEFLFHLHFQWIFLQSNTPSLTNYELLKIRSSSIALDKELKNISLFLIFIWKESSIVLLLHSYS